MLPYGCQSDGVEMGIAECTPVRYVGSRCGSGGPLLSLCQELARGYFPTHPPTGDDNQEYCAICVFTASS